MSSGCLRALSLVFGLLGALPAAADWARLDAASDGAAGARGCARIGGAQACLSLHCTDDGMAWALALPEMPAGPVKVTIDADSVRFTLNMSPDGAGGAHAAYAPEDHGALVSALKRGNRATVSMDVGRIAAFKLPLRGSSKALNHALAACAQTAETPAPAAEGATGDVPVFGQPSERFTALFGIEASAADIALARGLIAEDLEMIGDDAEVSVARYDIDGESSLLIIESGPSAMLYGVAGFGVTLAVLQGGAAWVIDQKDGTLIWADTKNGIGGWPDLWMQSVRGVNQPFGVWRWSGAEYMHQRNVAP